MTDRQIIKSARKRFDGELQSPEYKSIHADDHQLAKLLDLIDISPGKSYLDLGTGNGYVAFATAKKSSNIYVHGLDIATNTIRKNIEIAEHENVRNIGFLSYKGGVFPFNDKAFYGAISRYAFHHFPHAQESIAEINRVIEPDGFFILSDPQTYDDDDENFVDKFQSQVKDGHVHFYRYGEIESLFNDQHFTIEKSFDSIVRYPRIMNKKYEKLFNNTRKEILEKYQISIEQDKVYISVRVMNVKFRKN